MDELMNVLLVTYELNPGDNQPQIQTFIEQSDVMRFSPTAYAVRTTMDADAYFRQLEPLLHADDILYVISAAKPWMGYGYEAMNDWLKRNL